MSRNGHIILQALEEMEGPTTLARIVSHIAQRNNVDADEIKPAVLDTVTAGVQYGFLQRRNRRFFVESPNEMEMATNTSEVRRSRRRVRGGIKRRSVGRRTGRRNPRH